MATSVPEISDIKDEKSLELWLLNKPPQWAQAIAARIALRVAPTVWYAADVSARGVTGKQIQELVLNSFRACFISVASSRYPSIDFSAYAELASMPVPFTEGLVKQNEDNPSKEFAALLRKLAM